MSYILAALKKSEQERDRLEGGASLPLDTSVPSKDLTSPNDADVKPSSIVFIGMMSLVLLIFLFVFLWLRSLDGRLTEEVPFVAEVQSASEGAALKETVLNSTIVEVSTVDPEEIEIAVKEVAVADSVIAEPKAGIVPQIEIEAVNIEQGTQAQLSKVPSISVTSHIYSSQATRRSIVVNDQRLVEGDFVANQVQIKEITSQGMILEVDGLLFAVNRSRGWNR